MKGAAVDIIADRTRDYLISCVIQEWRQGRFSGVVIVHGNESGLFKIALRQEAGFQPQYYAGL